MWSCCACFNQPISRLVKNCPMSIWTLTGTFACTLNLGVPPPVVFWLDSKRRIVDTSHETHWLPTGYSNSEHYWQTIVKQTGCSKPNTNLANYPHQLNSTAFTNHQGSEVAMQDDSLPHLQLTIASAINYGNNNIDYDYHRKQGKQHQVVINEMTLFNLQRNISGTSFTCQVNNSKLTSPMVYSVRIDLNRK